MTKKKTARTRMPRLEAVPDKNVFVMMRYRSTDQFRGIESVITKTLAKNGLYARYAKDLPKAQWLWANITKYMDACKYGIAVFDSLPLARREPRLNPNVCTELGYMLAKDKECLILKDRGLKLQTDLQGFIFETFDGDRLETLQRKLDIWCEQQVTVLPLFHGFANLLPGSKIAKRLGDQSYAKLVIGKYLAEEYIPTIAPCSIVLDSGTSAAAVAEALFLNRDKYTKLDIHTNNVLASVLLCSAKQFNCSLVSGDVDQDFAGVFGPKACEGIQQCTADATVLACTGFTAEHGPFANSIDNRTFKRAIIDKTSETIIIVPSERLGKSVGSAVMQSVSEWKEVLKYNVSVVVTCPEMATSSFKKVQQKLGRKLKILDL